MQNQAKATSDTLRFEVLLRSKMLRDINVNEGLISSFEITPNKLVLLSTKNQFYLLGWGGMKPSVKKLANDIYSFTYTADKILMMISKDELFEMDSLGNPYKLFKLPNEEMGISTGKNVIFIYDRNKKKAKHGLYIIAKGHKYAKLFEVPAPINSVAEMHNLILFATENGLFSYNLKNKELKVITILPKKKEIKSIAIDTLKQRIYFSTDSMVYAIKDSNVVIITDKFGGVLKCFNKGLMLFNPEKKFLIRIVNIETQIEIAGKTFAVIKKSSDILTNATIINLVNTKLSDNLIINIINRSNVNFDLSVNAMINLSNQHVSSAVIMAMKNAMKKKNSN